MLGLVLKRAQLNRRDLKGSSTLAIVSGWVLTGLTAQGSSHRTNREKHVSLKVQISWLAVGKMF